MAQNSEGHIYTMADATNIAIQPDKFKTNVYIVLNPLTLRRLMSYVYGAPILDVSRSHTTTQHSR